MILDEKQMPDKVVREWINSLYGKSNSKVKQIQISTSMTGSFAYIKVFHPGYWNRDGGRKVAGSTLHLVVKPLCKLSAIGAHPEGDDVLFKVEGRLLKQHKRELADRFRIFIDLGAKK
jgi:hypothetical protein